MSANNARLRKGAGSTTVRRSQVIIAVVVLVSVMAAWAMLGYSSGLKTGSGRRATNAQSQSPENFSANSPSKEYIYAGARLIATQEPGGSQGSGNAAGFDFGGDHKSDISIFRPGDGSWRILNSDNNTQTVVGWGINGDTIVPADYDGDGKCDIAVFRPSDGTWWIKKSSDGGTSVYQFAVTNDIPVPADYDGDGKANVAVYRPSNGTWWILNLDNTTQTVVGWGLPGDRPVLADYDGDGKCDIAVFRPSDGT